MYESTTESVKELEELLNTEITIEEEILFLEEENKLVQKIKKELETLRLEILLNGEFDKNNAYVEIHSGAGGTESNDWADMLKRMYLFPFIKFPILFESISVKPVCVIVAAKVPSKM